jgi:uncharacterized protein (DUF58 family)
MYSNNDTVTLGFRQLYLLPTFPGVLYALLVLVLLIASINYGNGLGYALTFFCAALGLMAMLATHRNLHQLKIRAGRTQPVFAGEVARVEILLTNDSAQPRYGILIEQESPGGVKSAPWRPHRKKEIARLDLAAGETRGVELCLPAHRRGWLAPPGFCVSTIFPLSILYSWSRRVELPARLLVYPAPALPMPRTLAPDEGASGAARAAGEGDDFVGLREYRYGDSLRRVHWKAFARGQGLLTKEFGGNAVGSAWLDWDELPKLPTETRLSLLTRWVLDAERDNAAFGLKLPGTVLPPSLGEAHTARALKALALFGQPA